MQRKAVDPQDDEVSLKTRFERIKLSDHKRTWRKKIVAILIVLWLASLMLTIFGVNVSLSQPMINRILAAVALAITSLPAFLQLINWALPDSLRVLTIDGLAETAANLAARRDQSKFIKMYGCQELAAQLLEKEKAVKYSVAYRTQRRRRVNISVVVVALVLVLAGGLFEILSSETGNMQISRVGKTFSVDSTFAITILGAPRCSNGYCDVRTQFSNVSHYTADIGAGSFQSIGDPAQLCDVTNNLCSGPSYSIALIGPTGNYYNYNNAPTAFSKNLLQPGDTAIADLMFDVRPGAAIDQLRLIGVSKSASVIFRTR